MINSVYNRGNDGGQLPVGVMPKMSAIIVKAQNPIYVLESHRRFHESLFTSRPAMIENNDI
jgi:hypothetical protein